MNHLKAQKNRNRLYYRHANTVTRNPLRKQWRVTLTDGTTQTMPTAECTMERAYALAKMQFKNFKSIN